MILAEAPNAIKTTEKPAIKSSAFRTMAVLNRDRAFASVSCSMDRPVMYEIYEGTSGNTQGETNDSNPAENAAIKDMCVMDCDTRSTWTIPDCRDETCSGYDFINVSISWCASGASQSRAPKICCRTIPCRSTINVIGSVRAPYDNPTRKSASWRIGKVSLFSC